MKLFDQTR